MKRPVVPARVRTLVERSQERLEQERERHLAVAVAFLIADRGRQAAASTLAGALAFRFFLTLLPLTLLAVVGLGYLKSAGGNPSEAVKQFGVRGALAATINNSATFHDPGRTAVLLLAIVGVLSGARLTTATLRAVHALAWGIPVRRWRRGGRAGLLFLGVVVVGFACSGLTARARSAAGLALGLPASIISAGVAGGLWLGASWLLPHRDGIRWTALVPGAVLVGIGFAVLQALTVNLLGPKLQHGSALYGSLGVAFVVLGWLYLIGRLLVAAPLLNVSLLDHREARATKTAMPEPAASETELEKAARVSR